LKPKSVKPTTASIPSYSQKTSASDLKRKEDEPPQPQPTLLKKPKRVNTFACKPSDNSNLINPFQLLSNIDGAEDSLVDQEGDDTFQSQTITISSFYRSDEDDSNSDSDDQHDLLSMVDFRIPGCQHQDPDEHKLDALTETTKKGDFSKPLLSLLLERRSPTDFLNERLDLSAEVTMPIEFAKPKSADSARLEELDKGDNIEEIIETHSQATLVRTINAYFLS
jgi:hypothetical protein